ncbi:MAG: hypothetical protein ACKVZH_13735 [Blastocatellia bacterium]
MTSLSSRTQAIFWLLLCAALSSSLLVLFADSCQMDGGQHFLFSRWAWTHPELFVGVWSRPLFTFVYAFPALVGYQTARAFTVLICLAIGWQTWRLAEYFELRRAPLGIALLFLQPSFFLFSADTMTEPIFALIFVTALRLHHQGRVKAGMLVASLMALARPEGFFLGALWGIWVLAKAYEIPTSGDDFKPQISNLKTFRLTATLQILLLAAGSMLWWLMATLLTKDPLFIKHNWPSNWPVTGTMYGAHGLLAYPLRLPEMVGLFLLPAFVYGLVRLLKRRQLPTLTSSFLLLFVLHTIFRAFGLLGSAGYPRYLVAVSPAIALITLVGWNQMAKGFAHVARPVRTGCVAIVLAVSAWVNFVYADGAEWSRDAVAINDAYSVWQSQTPQPKITRFVWSKPYACILFDRDPWENPAFTRNHEQDFKTLRELPSGTLVVWEELAGPKEYGLNAMDFEMAGFVNLYSRPFALKGHILNRSWFGFGGTRRQTVSLLYKP